MSALAAVAPHSPGTNWTAVAAIAAVLVALFTATTMTVTGLAYRLELRRSGRRPLAVKRYRPVGSQLLPPATYLLPNLKPARWAVVNIFNHSDHDQYLTIDNGLSRVVWPTRHRIRTEVNEFKIEPHHGGNYSIPLLLLEGHEWPKRRSGSPTYWLRLIGMTRSGQRVRFLGAVLVTDVGPTTNGMQTQ